MRRSIVELLVGCGASLAIAFPTGEYFADKLVNLGTNRWASKPEVGVSYPRGPWTLEFYGGGWFFTRNSTGVYGTPPTVTRPRS